MAQDNKVDTKALADKAVDAATDAAVNAATKGVMDAVTRKMPLAGMAAGLLRDGVPATPEAAAKGVGNELFNKFVPGAQLVRDVVDGKGITASGVAGAVAGPVGGIVVDALGVGDKGISTHDLKGVAGNLADRAGSVGTSLGDTLKGITMPSIALPDLGSAFKGMASGIATETSAAALTAAPVDVAPAATATTAFANASQGDIRRRDAEIEAAQTADIDRRAKEMGESHTSRFGTDTYRNALRQVQHLPRR